MSKAIESQILVGDCRSMLRTLPAGCVQTCVTSPPYWGLRDYGVDEQIGLEATPAEFVATMVDVFREVRRVLADDGTLWLNLGDSYAGSGRGGYAGEKSTLDGSTNGQDESRVARGSQKHAGKHQSAIVDGSIGRAWTPVPAGLKPKDLVGIPWMVAFALRADGWYLRSDIVWAKPNPMPESVADRPTKSHEYLFLLSKSSSYFYDADAIAEDAIEVTSGNVDRKQRIDHGGAPSTGSNQAFAVPWSGTKRNKRSVWTVATQPYDGAHFATFPPKLIEPCILAGSRPGDIVLDPFFGSGTTGMVAEKHGRRWIGIDLNPKYAELAAGRTAQRSLKLGGVG